MILDVTGVELIPGCEGKDCPGNGEWYDCHGREVECCCEECDYFLCCFDQPPPKRCADCCETPCPRVGTNGRTHIAPTQAVYRKQPKP